MNRVMESSLLDIIYGPLRILPRQRLRARRCTRAIFAAQIGRHKIMRDTGGAKISGTRLLENRGCDGTVESFGGKKEREADLSGNGEREDDEKNWRSKCEEMRYTGGEKRWKCLLKRETSRLFEICLETREIFEMLE